MTGMGIEYPLMKVIASAVFVYLKAMFYHINTYITKLFHNAFSYQSIADIHLL